MRSLRQMAKRTFPGLYEFLAFSVGRSARYVRVAKLLSEKYGRKVVEGPFAGMLYTDRSIGSAYAPKLLGCYEMEMHPFIEQIIQQQHPVIVNVGCAEGYYAVGLALRCPNSRIYAFDIEQEARKLCQELAEINGVADRVKVGGQFDSTTLHRFGSEDTLIICDVDGYEEDLIDLSVSPALAHMDMLVELHEPFRPGSTKKITGRLAKTHKITIVDATDRDPKKFPIIQFLSSKDQKVALTEDRPAGQTYAYFQANSPTS